MSRSSHFRYSRRNLGGASTFGSRGIDAGATGRTTPRAAAGRVPGSDPAVFDDPAFDDPDFDDSAFDDPVCAAGAFDVPGFRAPVGAFAGTGACCGPFDPARAEALPGARADGAAGALEVAFAAGREGSLALDPSLEGAAGRDPDFGFDVAFGACDDDEAGRGLFFFAASLPFFKASSSPVRRPAARPTRPGKARSIRFPADAAKQHPPSRGLRLDHHK